MIDLIKNNNNKEADSCFSYKPASGNSKLSVDGMIPNKQPVRFD